MLGFQQFEKSLNLRSSQTAMKRPFSGIKLRKKILKNKRLLNLPLNAYRMQIIIQKPTNRHFGNHSNFIDSFSEKKLIPAAIVYVNSCKTFPQIESFFKNILPVSGKPEIMSVISAIFCLIL